MTPRALAASILALGIGAMAQSTDTWAGTGAHVAAPAFAARSVRPTFAPPSVRLFGRQPVHDGFRAGMNGFRLSQFRGRHEFDFRRQAGFPWWWGYTSGVPYDLPYDYPSEYGSTYELPATPYPQPSRPVVIHEPGCRTDTHKVPSEAGGETTINITRCY
jgi:hypothetical protein